MNKMKNIFKSIAVLTAVSFSCASFGSSFFDSTQLLEGESKFKCFEMSKDHSYVVHLLKSSTNQTVKSSEFGPSFNSKSFVTVQLNRIPEDIGFENPIYVSFPLEDDRGTPINTVDFAYTSSYVREGRTPEGDIDFSGEHSSTDIFYLFIPLTPEMSKIIKNPNKENSELRLQCFDIGRNDFAVYPNPAVVLQRW